MQNQRCLFTGNFKYDSRLMLLRFSHENMPEFVHYIALNFV